MTFVQSFACVHVVVRPWYAGQKLNPVGPVGDFTVTYRYVIDTI
jgi:hypothetical protein